MKKKNRDEKKEKWRNKKNREYYTRINRNLMHAEDAEDEED